MRVLIDLDGDRRSIDVDRWQSAATLGELVTTAGGALHAGDADLFVDEAAVPLDTPLDELVLLEGSRIARTPGTRRRQVAGWSVTLAGGLAAGQVVEVPRSRPLVVGRAPQADLVLPTASASWEHCTIENEPDGEGVRIRDAGSTNGTLIGGERVDAEGLVITEATTAIVGGAVLLVRPALAEVTVPAPGSLHNLTPASTAPFNRPPRPGRADDGEPVQPPDRKEVPPASKFSYITVLAPLLLAGAMVALLGDARFALFALLSPVTAIGMWLEQKHRRTKNLREEEERFENAIGEFSAEIAEAAAEEARRRFDLVPDPATVLRRPELPTTLLWQRRVGADDFLALHAGIGDVPWRPALDDRGSTRRDDRVKEALAAGRLASAPVVVDLTDAGVVGIVGDRAGALALARSLLAQAAVHCGPADLTIGTFCDPGRDGDWEWASWLPHTRQVGSSTGDRWMSARREASVSMLRGLRETVDEMPTPALLVVLDSEVLTEGRDAPARAILGHGRSTPGSSLRPNERSVRVSGIVIATSEEQLPASCTTVVVVGEDAAATVHRPEDRTRVDDVVLAGVDVPTAEECARHLAHFDDPELIVPGASLPSLVRLPELLGVPRVDAESVQSMWRARTGVSTPIGSSESGVLTLDLVADGPHGLVGGTTGSGKSEFLRSLVAGLAARNDPTRLNFILIDFKGGAAFAACERLPHTIGTISNLDEQLADRALRSLEAEMQRRQRVFAEAGDDIDNLEAYLATSPAEPMPRLLLVVDEFAMLAKDFPDVLSSLVSVAAVGRTLGVHMILATQRPAGVVNDDILANTNLRVALRVQSREDSSNVIGVPAAAGISRAQTGRAYVKLGQDDITPVQTALVTGRALEAAAEAVSVREIGQFGVPAPRPAPPRASAKDSTDLDELIDAIVAAHSEAGFAPPRQVWPEALGESIALAGFPTAEFPTAEGDGGGSGDGRGSRHDRVRGGGPQVGGVVGDRVVVALADEPDLQRQSPAGWDMAQGNLLVMGIPGSGTSTTLASLALALARETDPADLDLYVLDLGSRDLAPLADLPHTVAYVGPGAGAKEQQARFLRHLRTELEARRADPTGRRRAVVLLDGLAALRDELQDYEGQQLLDLLYRVYADGPALGLSFAVSTTRAKAVPSAMDEVTTQKWLFRLADPYDYASLGVKGKSIPAPVPGRLVDVTNRLQMHVATPAGSLVEAVAHVASVWSDAAPKSNAIGQLPDDVRVDELGLAPTFDDEPWRLPIGIGEDDLTPAVLEVYEGEHVLVAGPARSGKSTLLLAIAESIRSVSGSARPVVWGIGDRRSPLVHAPLDRVAVGADEVPALLAALRLERGPVVLLIDDAERFDDTDQSIATLLASNRPGLCVIAAGRSADLRTLYGHWTKTVRKSRCGVLLQPDVDYDGELLGVPLPRRAPVALTQGRGYAGAGGAVRLVQAMSPSVAEPARTA
ncbi:FtsK/SpoIIIE domain-containing protein [Frigoribacterium sp. CFBP9030]|uniref:FtsK/SpoIIIE domain-containing protein n=1 Tax=Frigoribacterium sp. CFBP9030 TaxID=3096537 RepID=UPI002A6A2179|nr:FtsK/SpoIIIE domain-containing protein [Frigoribacterium sp. CFBP9030]MDY0891823.1 FtsK/SpoIIIE domain-containing protein [Frigoribacterium sp. CFBP9030]